MTEQIDRWIAFMETHPDAWKKIHTQFINAQFSKAYAFIERLKKEKDGKKRIIEIYNIKNVEGYPNLLK